NKSEINMGMSSADIVIDHDNRNASEEERQSSLLANIQHERETRAREIAENNRHHEQMFEMYRQKSPDVDMDKIMEMFARQAISVTEANSAGAKPFLDAMTKISADMTNIANKAIDIAVQRGVASEAQSSPEPDGEADPKPDPEIKKIIDQAKETSN